MTLHLTPRETLLLNALRSGQMVTFGDLIKTTQTRKAYTEGSLHTLVCRLRGKIRQAGLRLRLVRVPRVGYRLALQVPADTPGAVPPACVSSPKLTPPQHLPRAAGPFRMSDPLLMRPPARTDASVNDRLLSLPTSETFSPPHSLTIQ